LLTPAPGPLEVRVTRLREFSPIRCMLTLEYVFLKILQRSWRNIWATF
jgi:hypothetical protein